MRPARGKLSSYTVSMKEYVRLPGRSRESAERPPLWKVAEVFSEARDAARGNEDGYLVTDHCVAVLDGVSTPGNPRDTEGKTPAQRAVDIGLAYLRDHPNLHAEDAVAQLSEALREAVREHRLQGAPSFVFAAFFPRQNRIVRVGDVSYLIDGVGYNPGMNADRAKAVVRKRILEPLIRHGMTEDELFADDPSRERMQELRNWQTAYANNADAADLGYGEINGTAVPDRFINYVTVPIDARSVVLASDGYPPSVLAETREQTEANLRALQARDPLGMKEDASVRAHRPRRGQTATDDRTYIKTERA